VGAVRKPRIGAIIKAAQCYRDHLLNRNLLLVGVNRDGKAACLQLRFLARHFKHLTGVRTQTKILANDFFNRALEGRLPEKEILPDGSGFAELKLKAAGSMFKPDLAVNAFGEPSGARLHVEVDVFAGNSYASLGFISDHDWFDPVTLLSSPIGDETLKQRRFRVVAVFPKGVGDSRYGAPSKVALKDATDVKSARQAIVDAVGQVSFEGVTGQVGYPYFGQLILDCINRTENAMTQEHCFKAAELCVKAQMQAQRLA